MRQASHASPETHGSERVPATASQLHAALAAVIADLTTLTQVHQLRASVVGHHRSLLPVSDVMFTRLVGDVLHVAYDENDPPENAHQLALLPVELDLPITQAARTARPVVVADRRSIDEGYPLLGTASHLEAVASIPVTPAGDPTTVLGVVSYWFDAAVDLSDDELDHLQVLARLSVALCPQPTGDTLPVGEVARVVRLRAVPLPSTEADTTSTEADTTSTEVGEPDEHERDEHVLGRLETLEREVATMRELLRFISAITHDRVGPT